MLLRVLSFVLSFILTSSMVFAQTWTPQKLELTAANYIQLDFGSDLSINVDVSGTPSYTVFCVFTHDMADEIIDIQNGYLGWHYVNKIDTCVYLNRGQQMQIGTNSIVWDGTDMDGNKVPPQIYTYYLFGYDNVNYKEMVTDIVDIGIGRYDTFIIHDYLGNPYVQPIYYTDPFLGTGDVDEPIPIRNDDPQSSEFEYTNRMKYTIGSDPFDLSGLERTWYDVYLEHSQFEPSPYEPDMFYIMTNNTTEYTGAIRKFKWVANGESELQTDWGDNGEVSWSIMTGGSWWVRMSACFSYINNDQLIGCNTDHGGFSTESELIRVDAQEGYEIDRIDLADWWIRPEDGDAGAQQSSGPNYAQFRVIHGQPLLSLTAHSSCIQNVINPHDEDGDWQRWINQNGDYLADHNWEPDSERPWVCNDYFPPARTYSASFDAEGFVLSSAFEEGAVSFHLFAPDGTGIDMFAYAGETTGPKYTNYVVQYGSSYDGIYCDNESASGSGWSEYIGGVWYIAHDSFSGIIECLFHPDSVEDGTPAAFAVEQNSPNPFNPATTINFSLAEAGNVAIDIYNTAGQKIDTLADGFMETGSHSVVWDASHVAAGIYFYTVTSGAYSKTMKMTLMK